MKKRGNGKKIFFVEPMDSSAAEALRQSSHVTPNSEKTVKLNGEKHTFFRVGWNGAVCLRGQMEGSQFKLHFWLKRGGKSIERCREF